MATPIPKADAEVIRWNSFLGHQFIAVVDDGKGGRSCCIMANTLKSARTNSANSTGAAIYKRTKAGWRLCK